MSTVADKYEDNEFEDLLDTAESYAANGWEQQFVSDMQDKWQQYGRRMYLSDKQDEILNRIAADEN